MPVVESKVDELKYLDMKVQNAGVAAAYPVYRKKQQKMKERLAPKILELSNEILKGEIKMGFE